MNLKYRVKFNITNLNTQELRDFKINLVTSNNVLEFDSDIIPRIPSTKDKIKIAGRIFEIENSDVEYILDGDHVFNVFNIYVFDVEKKREDDANSKDNKNQIKYFPEKQTIYSSDELMKMMRSYDWKSKVKSMTGRETYDEYDNDNFFNEL